MEFSWRRIPFATDSGSSIPITIARVYVEKFYNFSVGLVERGFTPFMIEEVVIPINSNSP